MEKNIDNVKNLKRMLSQKSLVDVAVQIEGFLDSMNLYVYPNWIDGEIVHGPILSRYWVSIILKYDGKQMPDPWGAKLLAKLGVRCKFKKDKELVSVKLRSPQDYEPGTKKPKKVAKDIWMIELAIPRRFIDEDYLEDLDTVDLEEFDVDEIIDAADKGIGFSGDKHV